MSTAVASRISGAISRSDATLVSESAYSSVAVLMDRPDTESCTVTWNRYFPGATAKSTIYTV